jgi:hypothetical protein
MAGCGGFHRTGVFGACEVCGLGLDGALCDLVFLREQGNPYCANISGTVINSQTSAWWRAVCFHLIIPNSQLHHPNQPFSHLHPVGKQYASPQPPLPDSLVLRPFPCSKNPWNRDSNSIKLKLISSLQAGSIHSTADFESPRLSRFLQVKYIIAYSGHRIVQGSAAFFRAFDSRMYVRRIITHR